MKKHGGKFLIGILLGLGLQACTKETVLETITPSIPEIQEEKEVMTIVASLPDNEAANSRLTYEEVLVGNYRIIKTLWSKEDALAVNAVPNDTNCVNIFYLKEGEGTGSAVFECNDYVHYSSQSRIVYYPASQILRDYDYLNFSYEGQVQKGNNNMDHLKDWHTMRLNCTGSDRLLISNPYVFSFSGDSLEQSSCMKFNLSGLPEIIPTEIMLEYINEDDSEGYCFHLYNLLDEAYVTTSNDFHVETTSRLKLSLADFSEKTSAITAYMMMSNYPVEITNGAKFRVTVTDEEGKKYYADKLITADAVLEGGCFHIITLTEGWQSGTSDVFNNVSSGSFVIQEATVGNGTDIVIMGDGFTEEQITDGTYEEIMRQAYEDFFSVEPYLSLKKYFNVYYVNAVSEEEHDAEPYYYDHPMYDNVIDRNGAINGDAVTVFGTQFVAGQTTVTGNNNLVLRYAMEAIRQKGGKGGTPCTDEDEIIRRGNTALSVVMINVECYAGTCVLAWTKDADYANAYSIAYTPLGYDGTGEQCKWTLIHEAGGHGFGKLADEYGSSTSGNFSFDSFYQQQSWGVYRNINSYWDADLAAQNPSISVDITTEDNLYWSGLLAEGYPYKETEGLSYYEGANGFATFFCRPTYNSVMRGQFDTNGHFFNAPSRMAIYYRLMKLIGEGTAWMDYTSSITDFYTWDPCKNLVLDSWDEASTLSRSNYVEKSTEVLPLSSPVLIEGRWINGRFVEE